MKTHLKRIWNEDQGVLTFEWILLITLLVIGIVGGLSAVRDATISELGDLSHAIVNIDQSYTVNDSPCIPGDSGFGWTDDEEFVTECRPDEPAVTQGGPEAPWVAPTN